MYSSMILAFVYVFVLTAISTYVLSKIFNYFGKRGFLGNLYPNVRGGIPRAIGIVPFIMLSLYVLPGYNNLVLIIGICALIDDIMGRKKIESLGIEWGQLSRGIGILLVMIVGFIQGLGISAVFIALMVQPLNIADMQPGSACMVTMIMSIMTFIFMIIVGSPNVSELPAFYTPLLLFVVCLAYSPLDFVGKIMLGEVGNHVFAVTLGISFYLIGGIWWLLLFAIATVCLTAFVRRSTLKVFFRQRMRLLDPTFGDFFMDVLTGGGLGDMFRKLILKDKQYVITSPILISLGFRRLLYNPYATHPKAYSPRESKVKPKLGR